MKTGRRGAKVAVMVSIVAAVVLAAGIGTAVAAIEPVAVGGRYPQDPAVSGGTVVWADAALTGSGNDIWRYDRATGLSSVAVSGASDQTDPDISGNLLVWTDFRSGSSDIYVKDLSTGIEAPLAASGNNELKASIDGPWVTYQELTTGSFPGQYVYARNVVTGESMAVGNSATNPRVGGSIVVFEKSTPRGDTDVIACDVVAKTWTTVASGTGTELLPDTDGRYVAWVEYGPKDFDIGIYDLVTGRRTTISAPGEQTAPRVSGGVVYYLDVPLKGAIRARAVDAATGQARRLDTGSITDVAAFEPDGTNATWLERGRSGWRVRALIDSAPTPVGNIIGAAKAAALDLAAALTPGDLVAPRVTGSYKRTLTPRTPAWIYFSERLSAASVVRGVRLVDARGRAVRAKVGYLDRRRAVSVAPLAPLKAGEYAIVVTTAVRDRAGNRSAEQVVPLGSAALAAVARPGAPVSRVVGSTGQVSVTWNVVSGAVGYRVFRLNRPITSANLGLAAQVASVAAPPAVFAPASDEASTSFTYYYAVYAQDSLGASSTLSDNTSPNPHGSQQPGFSVYTCLRCHTAHGGAASGAATAGQAEGCYECHGGTSQASTYGTATLGNTQAQFNDYSVPATCGAPSTDTAGNGGWSIHRTNAMVLGRNECEACHTPHRRPYYRNPSTGVYDATLSFNKLLRVRVATSVPDVSSNYYYSSDATPTGNAMCFKCHGTVGVEGSAGSLTSMIIANGGWSGSGAMSLDRTGGDHNEAAWSTAALAHGRVRVTTMSANPGIQCEVCHNNHGASTDRLIDFRRSATQTADAYRQSKLCFECHTTLANGADETRSLGARPYTWNGRDVKAEFARRSSHPSATAGTGRSATCYSCHNTHYVGRGATATQWDISRVSDPANTKSTPATTTDFCMGCHGTTGVAASFSRTWVRPYAIATSTVASPLFPGWQKRMWTGSGHASATVANGRAWCDNCHDPHGSDYDNLVAWSSMNTSSWAGTTAVGATRNSSATANASNIDAAGSFGRQVSREEALCLQCHGSGGSIATSDGATILSRKAPGAGAVGTVTVLTYRHSAVSSVGVHSDTETGSGLGASNRHAECVDCHDVHAAKKVSGGATHTPNTSLAGGALYGVFGVVPSYPPTSPFSASTTGTASNFTTPTGTWTYYQLDGGAQDYEAYLCFKCHSSYTTLPTNRNVPSRNTTPTDLAREFNPANFSLHNVIGTATPVKESFVVTDTGGTRRTIAWAWPATAFSTANVSGLSKTYKMTCTDCHSMNAASAKGPHGSSTPYMLVSGTTASWHTQTITNWANTVCSRCHVSNTNNVHSRSDHTGVACNYCHVKVPHGWKRPRLLGYTSDPEPYRATWMQGITSSKTAITPTGWTRTDCGGTACGGEHGTVPNPRWP